MSAAIAQPRPTRLRLVLAALCVALLGVIYLETSQPDIDLTAHPVAQHRVAPAVEGDDATSAMPSLDSLADVLRRPLFSPNRRPPAVSAAAAANADATGFTLVGVVISPRGSRALIEHGQPPHLDHAREQQEIDGWTVEKILGDRVVLRHAEDRVELKVKDAPPPQVPGAPIPTAAGPLAAPPLPPGTFPAPHFMGGALNVVPPGQQR